jgi:hypothetical protein
MMTLFGDSYYTIHELMKMFHCSRKFLIRKALNGEIPANRHPLTQRIIFPKDKIDQLKDKFVKDYSKTSA